MSKLLLGPHDLRKLLPEEAVVELEKFALDKLGEIIAREARKFSVEAIADAVTNRVSMQQVKEILQTGGPVEKAISVAVKSAISHEVRVSILEEVKRIETAMYKAIDARSTAADKKEVQKIVKEELRSMFK